MNAAFARKASAALAAPIVLAMMAVAALCLYSALNWDAWMGLWEAPGLLKGIAMTLWTGLASTAIAWGLSAWLLSKAVGTPYWHRLLRSVSPLLAVPHAAFAVGWVFLIAPSGWLFRAVSPWLSGWEQPPPIASSQDAWGFGLIAMLVFKEVPFLLWAAATQLQRDDTAERWQREAWAAQVLGYSRSSTFWRIIWPQLSPRLVWPLLAVLAYGLSVVDAALIAGPGSPATLSVRAWQWLQDGDDATNAVGAAAGWLLTAMVVVSAAGIQWGSRLIKRLRKLSDTGLRGTESTAAAWNSGHCVWAGILVIYGAVLLALAVGSVAGLWPFPNVMPNSLSGEAWQAVFDSRHSIAVTLSLAICSTVISLVWVVAWLELAPLHWDAAMRRVLYLPLLLPNILWVVGMHRLALNGGMTGTWVGVLLAHCLAVLPYTIITLSPAYQGFDARYGHLAATLGKTPWAFLRQVKWPLLRQSLWSAAAVSFAVSVAQFLVTVYVGEGRWVTLTTEAVTLSSGGQLSLLAAFAWLQWCLPSLAFAAAAWLGRARRWPS
jgi:putative thiamine transport system permease protein